MPLLAVNGVTFPVALDGYAEKIREVGGDIATSYNGMGLKSLYNIAAKSDPTIEASPMPATDAAAWARMLAGDGETWSFGTAAAGTFYGSRGTGPTTTSGLSTSTAGPGAVGGRKLLIAPATFFEVLFTSIDWTVMVWRGVAGVSVDHYIATSGGHRWFNGVRSDGTPMSWLQNVAGTSMKVAGDAVNTMSVDEVVMLPFVIPDAWGPGLFAFNNAGPFAPLPRLGVSGDAFGSGVTRFFLGTVTDNRPLRKDGSYRRLSVSLLET